MDKPKFNCKSLIIGHRGVKSVIMENTLESILHGIDMGVDGIEFDIQKCFTGELVLFHDRTLDRLAFKDDFFFQHSQNKTIDKLQWYHLYNTELIDLMGRKYKIPKLIDILRHPKVYKSDILINIEIKDTKSDELLADMIWDLVEEGLYNPGRFMISSYNIDSLIYFNEFKEDSEKKNQNYQNLKIGYIFAQKSLPQNGLLNEVKMRSKVITHVVIEKIILNQNLLDDIKEINLGVFVYTINDLSKIMIKNIENKVEGIITDKPEIFINI